MTELNMIQSIGIPRPSASYRGSVSVLVQVNHRSASDFCGVAQPLCCGMTPFVFQNFCQLVLLLDVLCDLLGRPEREDAMRWFPSGNRAAAPALVPGKLEIGPKLGHFTVEIVHRQNQSLQGRLFVPGRGDIPTGRKFFRSDMELLSLMRSYMA